MKKLFEKLEKAIVSDPFTMLTFVIGVCMTVVMAVNIIVWICLN